MLKKETKKFQLHSFHSSKFSFFHFRFEDILLYPFSKNFIEFSLRSVSSLLKKCRKINKNKFSIGWVFPDWKFCGWCANCRFKLPSPASHPTPLLLRVYIDEGGKSRKKNYGNIQSGADSPNKAMRNIFNPVIY